MAGTDGGLATGKPASKPELPFLLLAGSTMFALILGDFANDIAKWTVCAFSERVCSNNAKATAVMLATMLSTFVAVYSAVLVGQTGEKTRKEADLMIVGAMAGAFFALLSAAEGKESGYPELDALVRPLIIYVVASGVVLIPLMLARLGWLAKEGAHRLLSRIALSFFAATCLGGVAQTTAQELWTTIEDNNSATKFVVAPVAPMVAAAVFGPLMFHPWPGRHGRAVGVIGWLTFGAVAAVAFFLIAYLPDHGDEAGWLASDNRSILRVGFFYCLLLLSGVLMMAAAALGGNAAGEMRRLGILAAPFAALAALCGYELGSARLAAERLSDGDPLILGGLHGLGPLIGILAVVIAGALHTRLSRLYGNGTQAATASI